MANHLSFFFGVELELLIGSRSKTHKTWKSLAAEVSTKLRKAGLANHVNEGNDKAIEHYEEWSIVQEVTVPSQPGKNLWGIELVSPILDLSTPWEAHLSLIFKTLKSSFTISSSPNTSTHVHLSTSPALPPGYLNAIAKSILYFEPAMDLLLPSTRASSYWCQSNRINPVMKSLSLPQCFEHLDYCSDVHDVARAMCSFSAQSAYGRANGYTEDFVHGVYKWDFSGMVDPSSCLSTNLAPNGTLEYRQCPGSSSSEEARTWIMLALSFTAGSMDSAGLLDPETPVRMEDLWWTVSSGLQTLGMADGDIRGIEKLFSGTKKSRGGRQ
ncbi:putative amidoligase enzyme-domain-containing protein [Truncatella angustata]|uniref:Amidoligase enzyme-domain-containing protein n=1 Tax=Truncatella angustata TaxID=152316 RepID=A0A9P8UYF2_9PEZI|nr:putative amidoligase enzyme-domain-containing protein [Truncatella angustata]KAH6660836.1 putative amidoligase enzyme-domain-containing protein [Truncatella angustata]KAH8196904.1 hypothetical protein TruAng_008929 [Truncatella angustata]